MLLFFSTYKRKENLPQQRKKTKHELHLTKFRFYPSNLQ